MNMIRTNYAVCIQYGKIYVVFHRNYFPKLKNYSRLRPPPNASYIHRKCGSIKNGAGWTLIESIIILSIRAIFGDLG